MEFYRISRVTKQSGAGGQSSCSCIKCGLVLASTGGGEFICQECLGDLRDKQRGKI